MGRAPSAVWNEVHRNRVYGTYISQKADHKAYVRRTYAKYQGMKIVRHPRLREEVETRLFDDQSPELVAGHISTHKKHLPSISKNAIYRYIGSVYGRRIETHRFLKKRRRHRRKTPAGKLPPRTFIGQRPKNINARSRIGDTEADFIVSGTSGAGIILVVADRKSRAPFLEKILPVTIPAVHRGFVHIKKRFPEMRSATCDNDILLVRYKELEQHLDITIYFCHPYHAWEKGSVEHVNGVIRRDIPKGANIARYSKKYIQKLEEKLQRRPIKVLGFKTPRQVLDAYRARIRTNKKHRDERHSI